MIIRIIVLIGVKEQCALYPNIQSLLADESGITVITAATADAISAASNIKNFIIFNIQSINTFISIEYPSFFSFFTILFYYLITFIYSKRTIEYQFCSSSLFLRVYMGNPYFFTVVKISIPKL